MKIREATLAELTPPERKPRPLSPRQLAIRNRDLVIRKVLAELDKGPASKVKRIELEEGEKLPTIRAAVARQVRAEKSKVRVSLRNGALYLSLGPLPR